MTSREVADIAFVSRVADSLCYRGLQHQALIGLEVGRPVAFLIGQLLWVFQPMLGLIISRDEVTKMAQLMEDPIAVNHLITLLDSENGM